MRCVARRVSDGAMLHLVKMWLEAPVEETDDRGRKHRTTRNRDESRGTPLAAMRAMMSKLKLTVNETKTHVCRVPQEKFDFLGYTFGRCYSPQSGRAFIGTTPSKKRVKRVCSTIGELTSHQTTQQDVGRLVTRLNRILIGWANYFSLGPVSRAYRAVEQHTRRRLRQWLADKHKMRARVKTTFTNQYLHQTLGLVSLGTRKARYLWAET